MLKLKNVADNRKTGPIATTYRSGEHETYGTCPRTCALHPKGEAGAYQIDDDYMRAVFEAVPPGGIAWTYSHFPAESLPAPQPRRTVFNASCDSIEEALRAMDAGRPATYAAPVGTTWPQRIEGRRFVRCPAETVEGVTCHTCGGGKPLCARGDRDYAIVFVAHGSGKAKVGTDQQGGCYAAAGRTAIHWHRVRQTGLRNDASTLLEWAATLPRGSMLRHHVAGDIGREVTPC